MSGVAVGQVSARVEKWTRPLHRWGGDLEALTDHLDALRPTGSRSPPVGGARHGPGPGRSAARGGARLACRAHGESAPATTGADAVETDRAGADVGCRQFGEY